MNKRILELYMALIMLLLIYFVANHEAYLSVFSKIDKEITVIVDAGHGGVDPGKVGKCGNLEKDINLQIAKKLRDILSSQDIKVIMTREDDIGLYEEKASNKKRSDMRERCKVINESNASLVVSIHQNSYTSGEIRGAQTFYYSKSDESRKLAKSIQEQLISTVDKVNRRKEKENNNYFILLNSNCPAVIVECGFLSNYEECTLLSTDEYQEKIAWAIHKGVFEYINKK